MANDKKIKLDFETTADLTSAEQVKQVLTDVEDRLRKIENEGKDEGLEKRIKKMRKLAAETENLADAYVSFEVGTPAAEDFKIRIDELHASMQELEQETSDTSESISDYVEQADKAAEAMENDAEAAQKMGEDLKEINFAQHIQLAGQFATGLRSLAAISKDNGQKELAKDLDSAAKGMDVVSGAAAGGLNLAKIIKGAGGARGALSKVSTFLTGPMGIALAAAAAAWGLFQIAVEKSNDELDAMLEKNAESVGVVQTTAEVEKAARDSIRDAIEDQQVAVEGLIKVQRDELQLAQEKRRLEVARTNADKAVALAQVDADRRSGDISEVEAIKQRAEIEGQAVARLHAANKKERDDVLAALNKRLEGEREQLELIRQQVETAKAVAKTPRRVLTDEEKGRLSELNQDREDLRAGARSLGRELAPGNKQIQESTDESSEILSKAEARANEELRAGASLEVAAKAAEELGKKYLRAARIFQKTINQVDATSRKLGVDQKEDDIKQRGTEESAKIQTDSRAQQAAISAKKDDRQKIIADAKSTFSDLLEKIDEGTDEQKELSGKTAEQLKAAQKQVDEAKDTLKKVLADGEVDAGEVKEFTEAIATLKREINGANKKTLSLVRDLASNQKTFAAQQQQVKREMANLRAVAEGLQ